MTNDLIGPGDLVDLPGAPFTAVEVDAAVTALRRLLGWHVAPMRVDVVGVDVNQPARYMTLPTRRLVSVDEVRDADTGEVVAADRYRTSTHLHSVRRCGSWPLGYDSVEVDMTHGYAECPADLLPVIAGIIRGGRGGHQGPITSVGVGAHQVSFGDAGVPAFSAQATIDGYSLYGGVVIA